jgi:hypothetical protein
MTQFCIMSETKEYTLTNEQTQDLIGHLVAALVDGEGVKMSEMECPDGCHTSIMLNGVRAARVKR